MAQMTTEAWVESIQSRLMEELTKHKKALPPGFNPERFILNSITVIQDMLKDKKKREQLQNVRVETIPVCLAKAAYLGLDFMMGECYAIPYGATMKFQTDYKGEVKLCKKYSKEPIKDIFAKVVREGDFFEESVDGGTQKVVFKPKPFSNEKIIGAFAVVAYKDGSMSYDTMSSEEIEKVRNVYSKAKDSQAWKESPGEMYKKTVIRRLSKLIDKNFDDIEQLRAYEDGGDVEFENRIPGRSQAALPDNGEPLDVFAAAKSAQNQKKEPVKSTTRKQSEYEEEFREFEEQHEPWADDGYGIPDDLPGEEELPYR